MEYYADEIEGNEDDAMLYNKIGRMVDVDDEYCHEVVKRSDKKSNLELFVGGLDENATEVNGKQCGLEPCDQSNALFLANICEQWIQQKELKDFRLARDISNVRINCGFALLEFSSHSDAMSAYKRLQKQDVVLGVDRSAKVCFAYPHVDLRDQIVAKVTRVFLDGVPPSRDDRDVRELVKKFGKIEKIELARYKSSAKRRDYGFVTFYSHDAAVACAEPINNAEFGKGHHEATLSQPFSKWEWKHQFCGNLHLVERPGSGALRYSTDIPTSASAISMHETRELKPRMQSSSSGHKRAVGSMKKDYAGQDDLPPRKRHGSDCGFGVGKSHERGYPFEGHGISIDSCRGLSYSQIRRKCASETCSHSGLASSRYEADAYDHSSFYGLKRQHSSLEKYSSNLCQVTIVDLGLIPATRSMKVILNIQMFMEMTQYVDVFENDSPYVDVDVYYIAGLKDLTQDIRSVADLVQNHRGVC
ncbi:hypothetical protein CRYUN_Cryun19dG0150600 [Craigia yunnanensis]